MTTSQLLTALIPGLALVAFGGLMMRGHFLTWQKQQAEGLDEFDRRHLSRRYRRRMQASGMLFFLGFVIPPGMLFLTENEPRAFGLFWFAVLIVAIWIILLAAGDALSIRTHAGISQARLELKKRELEAELQKHKARQGNGHATNGKS